MLDNASKITFSKSTTNNMLDVNKDVVRARVVADKKVVMLNEEPATRNKSVPDVLNAKMDANIGKEVHTSNVGHNVAGVRLDVDKRVVILQDAKATNIKLSDKRHQDVEVEEVHVNNVEHAANTKENNSRVHKENLTTSVNKEVQDASNNNTNLRHCHAVVSRGISQSSTTAFQ